MYSSILPITNSYGRVFKCDQNYNAIAQIVNQTNSKRNSQKREMKPFCKRQLGVRLRDKSCLAPASGLEMGKKSIDVGLEASGTWVGTELVAKTMAGLPERDCFFFWLILWMHFTSTMITSLFIWVYSTYQYMIWVWVFSNQRDVTTNHESNINSPFINCKSVHLNVTGRPTISFLVLLVHIDLFGIATPVVPKPGVPGSRNNQFGNICEMDHNKTAKISFFLIFYCLKKYKSHRLGHVLHVVIYRAWKD